MREIMKEKDSEVEVQNAFKIVIFSMQSIDYGLNYLKKLKNRQDYKTDFLIFVRFCLSGK